jgi:tetratricopeptide (TPR) repeat protein
MFCAMNLTSLNIRSFIFVCLLTSGLETYAQDTTLKFNLGTSFFKTVSLRRCLPSFNYIYHAPDKKDEQLYKSHKSLIGQKPTAKNHELYYSLACSLWELNKIAEAEKMFLTIVNSKEKYYTSTYYHSSDIPGKKIKNIYGYGSFTSNYKNHAAIYLTKIYLQQKKFDIALQFLEDAVKKYKVTFSCGIGFRRQQDEYDFLFASCYEGLARHKDVIELLLPSCLDRNDDIIIAAIKKIYSEKEIQESLRKAETSIQCSLDTFPSFAYRTTYSETKKEKIDKLRYFSGKATIILFDRRINMPVPELENGEQLTREMFVKLFKETELYIKLKDGT